MCQAAGALYKAIYCVRVVYREQERERLKTESLKHRFEADWKKTTIIWVLQSQRIEVFILKDPATRFCSEVLFVPRGIIVFFQFIVP